MTDMIEACGTWDMPSYPPVIEGELDEDKVWVNRNEEEIPYEKLETSHIQNIIRMFNFKRKDMPNLFRELDKRLSKLKDNK